MKGNGLTMLHVHILYRSWSECTIKYRTFSWSYDVCFNHVYRRDDLKPWFARSLGLLDGNTSPIIGVSKE